MITKPCRTCGSEKPLSDFHHHSRMADGHLNHCKPCVRARVKKHRVENIEHVRAYDRARPRRQSRQPQKYNVRWSEESQRKRQARAAVYNATKDGRLVRPGECDDCGGSCRPDAHHNDYSKALDVVWLCKRCHGTRHKRARGLPAFVPRKRRTRWDNPEVPF